MTFEVAADICFGAGPPPKLPTFSSTLSHMPILNIPFFIPLSAPPSLKMMESGMSARHFLSVCSGLGY